jgi:hypothetical protein
MNNGQQLPKCLHGNTFWEFWYQEFFQWKKILSAIFMETQILFKQKNFSFQTYTKSTICIF